MRLWREKALTIATLIILMELNELNTSRTTKREEDPEEIYRRLEEAHNKKLREKEAKGHIKDANHTSNDKDDEYTYEYETVEELATPSTNSLDRMADYNRIGTRKHRKSEKKQPSSEIVRKRPSNVQSPRETFAIDSAIVETLQKKKKKGDITLRERELAKKDLLKGKPMKAHWGDSASAEEAKYVDARSFEKAAAQGASPGKHNAHAQHEKKEYTYEYNTVEHEEKSDSQMQQRLDLNGSRPGRDDEYTYEYETVENKTDVEREMTSKEKFDKALAEYHAEQDRKHKLWHPEEYDDQIKVEGMNIKDIKDDTNETLLNYDEHGNFKWRKEWEHLKVTYPKPTTSTTTTSTTRRPYLASGEPDVDVEEPEQLQEYRDSQDRSYSNIYDERLQAKLARGKEEQRRLGATRNQEVQEIMNMIENMVVTDSTEITRSHPTQVTTKSHLMDNFRKHMSVILGSTSGGSTVPGLTTSASTVPLKTKPATKRRTTTSTILAMSTRSLAERAERRERKLNYKKKLLELKQRRMKHQNLFLKMRGFEMYTDAPATDPPGVLYEEDSFDREYFYLKSERAFKRWLKYNKYRFPQLNENKRNDYEILLRCWDTDIKKARKGIPIVTLYPPPSTFEPSGELPHPPEYEYLGVSPKPVTRKSFKDSLEEAFYRRYDVLKHNRTFESLEKIIQEKEGPKYKAPQLDVSEFNRKFWNVLLKEEHKDYERRALDKERLNRVQQLRKQHRDSIEGIASVYERQRWIRLQIKKQLETKSTTIDRCVELDEEGREWFKGVRGITGDLPDEFFLDDKTDLPKHLRWRVELPAKVKKRKIEREKKKEMELLEKGIISTTSDPLDIYKRLFRPLEMPEWREGLKTTTAPTTTTQGTTETLHWFWRKYSKYFTEDNVDELKRAYEGVPKRYLTQWMATWCPNLTDFYRIPDDYDPPEWQEKREEYIQYRRKKIKTTTVKDISSDESWHTPYGKDVPFTYPTMTITWDYVGPNQTRYFGLLAKAKDKVADRVVLDSDYLAQMWEKSDSRLEKFGLPRYQCLRCNKTFDVSEELNEHHQEHLKQEKLLEQHMMMNGSYTRRKKTIPPNKSYLFYYYSDAEDMESSGVFKPDYPKYG